MVTVTHSFLSMVNSHKGNLSYIRYILDMILTCEEPPCSVIFLEGKAEGNIRNTSFIMRVSTNMRWLAKLTVQDWTSSLTVTFHETRKPNQTQKH